MKKKRHVLIVEDDKYLLEFYKNLQAILKNEVDFKIATNGGSAIEILKKETFDSLILDLIMPEIDGYEVLAFLQKREKKSDKMHISVLTNLDTEEDRIRTKELGANDYYVKADLSNRVLKNIVLGVTIN